MCAVIPPPHSYFAGVAELADAPDLGSGGYPCRFKSCHPYQKGRRFTASPFGTGDTVNLPALCAEQAKPQSGFVASPQDLAWQVGGEAAVLSPV